MTDDWDNYPAECCARFLASSRRCPTASQGMKRHFIYPECDQILDSYLDWLAVENLIAD